MRRRVFLVAVPVTLIIIIIALQAGKQAAVDPEPILPPEPVKVWTRMDTLVHTYDSILSAEIDSAGILGAAIVVVHKGEVALLRCHGVTVQGTTDSIDAHTIFRLASVSKPITGTLAGLLSSQGTLPLDARVIDFLPGFRLKDSANTYMMTLAHLLSHTSGLVPHAYDNLVEAGVAFRIILDSLFRVNISAPPGELYGYQNVMFSVYDTVAKAATGKSFESLMRENVFGPFGMTDASVGYHDFAENTNRALPHSRGYIREPSENNMRYFLTNPAAGINASISDMAAFMNAMLGHAPEAIDSATIECILEPAVQSPLRWVYLRNWKSVESKHYALGWRIIGSYGTEIAYHGGYIRGYRAELAICRDEDFGIAYLTNSPNHIGSAVVPLFLDLYFGGR
jgi:beta-lactamase class C